MQALRALAHKHRLLAMIVVLCALALKAAVPSGYMIGQHGKVFTVEICADASGGTVTRQIVVPQAGGHENAADSHDKAPATCPYAALGPATLGGADAVLLALAMAFILALGFVPAPALPLRRLFRVLPPACGPPARA
jgi:hypothetical protein